MNYCDDSYAAMLLCLSLAPNKDEYAKPLTTAEYRDLCERISNTTLSRVSRLMNVDISGIMQLMSMSEDEAYRIYALLSRTVQLSYAMDNFAERDIHIVTEFDDEYPYKVMNRLGADAPPVFFLYGDEAVFKSPSVSIMGMSGVKTVPEARQSIETIVSFAEEAGYRVMTGGELGVSRVAEGNILNSTCSLTSVCGGGLSEYVARPEIRRLKEEGRLTAISLQHPDAAFDLPSAIARNRLMFALSDAVFVFNTDMKRGEMDALRNKRNEWIYAFEGYEGNKLLLSKGVTGFSKLTKEGLSDMSVQWRASHYEQMNIFDYFDI